MLTGRVLVNGIPATGGMKVTMLDYITLDGMVVRPLEERVLVAYHKPRGTTCTTRDVHADRTVYEDVQVFVHDRPVRLSYAGRLDRDSEGLLLFTNDGDLIERITRGKFKQEKEYLVAVKRMSDDRELLEDKIVALRNGVFLQELNRSTLPCEVTHLVGEPAERFISDMEHAVRQVRAEGDVPLRAPRGKKIDASDIIVLRFVLTQGLNRQIRRMCEAVGLKVMRLMRVRVMNIHLGDLKPGSWRFLTDEEEAELLALIEKKS